MVRKSLEKLGTFFVLSLALCVITTMAASAKAFTLSTNNKTNASKGDDPKESRKYRKPGKTTSTTLSQIVQEALTYHPSIQADKEALSASDDVIDQAVAGYMPSVDLRASLGREHIERNFSLNILDPLVSIGTITQTRTDPSITIKQILFDGMGTSSRVDRAHSQRNQARGTLGVTTDTATVDAATAAIDVRRLQRLLRIVNYNIRFHQNITAKVAEIVQAGAAPISDLYQLEARLQDTFVSQSNIASDLEVAKAKFIEVIGKEPPDHIKRIHFPSHLTSISIEMAVRMALDNNNSIKVAKSNVQIAESNHRESGSKLVPTVTFELEGERDRNISGSSGFQNRITGMFVARHNLFSGGADMAKSRETVKRLTESHARLNLAHRQTERTIRAAWGEARNAHAKSAHLTKLIHEKRLIRDTYLSEFAVGKRSLMDILDAANDVFLTEATRTTADATADINTVVLTVGTGQFQRFINKSGDDEFEQEAIDPNDLDSTTRKVDLDAPLRLTPYNVSAQTQPLKKNTKIKTVALRRKSLFEKRKEQRLNGIPDKSTT